MLNTNERCRASADALALTLLEAAELAGVRVRVFDGRLRAIGPPGTRSVIVARLEHEPLLVAFVGDTCDVYYLTTAELERLRQLRDRINKTAANA